MKLLQSLTGPSETPKGRSVSRPGGRFNPSQVRLKRIRTPRHSYTRRGFNPSQVRLKPRPHSRRWTAACFNPSQVRLKLRLHVGDRGRRGASIPHRSVWNTWSVPFPGHAPQLQSLTGPSETSSPWATPWTMSSLQSLTGPSETVPTCSWPHLTQRLQSLTGPSETRFDDLPLALEGASIPHRSV